MHLLGLHHLLFPMKIVLFIREAKQEFINSSLFISYCHLTHTALGLIHCLLHKNLVLIIKPFYFINSKHDK